MQKITYVLRVITVAPFMAFAMLLLLFCLDPAVFGNPAYFVMGLLFLVVLPLLAYPLQPFIRAFRDKGRDGQRTLAMIFAVVGYVLGCVFALALNAPHGVWVIFLSYLLSGLLIFVSSKVLRFKASGHTCGVTGPFMLLVYFGQPIGYIGLVFLALAWWSSLKMQRHTVAQLAAGTIVPAVALGLLYLVSVA